MRAFYLFSVWLHIVSAAVWIGGMVFISLVLVPVIRRQQEYLGIAASVIRRTGVRFRWVGWACVAVLILTGAFNLVYRGFAWTGGVIAVKLLLVAAILVLSIIHDFVVGPKATALWLSSPKSHDSMRLRRQASWIGRINLLLALIVMALGIMLVRGSTW